MYFLIDGYNLLFTSMEGKESIEAKRKHLVSWLQRDFKRLALRGMIVFDGSHRKEEESGLSYPSPMELAFTPKGQSADENILERVGAIKNRANATVVTNDRGLLRQASAMGAKVMGNSEFFTWLKKRALKQKSKGKRPIQDSPHQIERLRKIFEEKEE